ncbi:MAG TPA: RNA polymerase sigma factor SigJ [Solirubrobacteraceae bacterium]|nr:RNA polymerase sigma factor SigJ [Solirubrobacteraceae bacterium]
MNDSQLYAEQFEQHRAHLRAVAYRMLGSHADAEDAVQEAWLRLNRADADAVANLGGWLTTVVGRICIDMLRTRRVRNEDYPGTWLPEPLVSVDETLDPAREAELADAVGLALLVVLETLTPTERLAFVLHDMFAVPFDEIAPIVGRSSTATRQLASRARRRVRGAPAPESDLARQRKVVEAFLAASRGGDFEGLLAVLDPDVVFRVDAGRDSPLARPPIVGAENVAREVLAHGRPFAPLGRPALVGDAIGMLVGPPERPLAVAGCAIVDGRIAALDLIVDPEKLAAIVVAG